MSTVKTKARRPAAKPARRIAERRGEMSAMDYYMEDVSRYPMLTREQEIEIGRRALAGDEEAQSQLVTANLRFVASRVRKMQSIPNVDPMDLITAGNMGMMHAAKKYDPDRGVKFVGYASFWVRQFIQKEIDTNGDQMRTSVTQIGLTRRVRRLQESAQRVLGRQLTVEELAGRTGRHHDRIREALQYKVVLKSLDDPLESDDGSNMTLAHVIGDQDVRAEKERERELRELVMRVLNDVLTPRERRIIVDHFGLSGNHAQSLQDIGIALGITRERVRQICRKALSKIVQARHFHEELFEYHTPNPDHPLGTFLINSRKRAPLPPGVSKEEHRRQVLAAAGKEA